MVSTIRGLKWLSIDLTHQCNLNCSFCGKHIENSDYVMSIEQVLDVIKYFLGYDSIRVSGGESLTHPYFQEVMKMLIAAYGNVTIATNGLLIPDLKSSLFTQLHFLVSDYTGINDEILEEYSWWNNVEVLDVNIKDRDRDPNLKDEQLVTCYERCPYVQVRVIDGRVYGCCHAETVERVHGGDFGVPVGPDWMEELEELERWEACRHCWMGR